MNPLTIPHIAHDIISRFNLGNLIKLARVSHIWHKEACNIIEKLPQTKDNFDIAIKQYIPRYLKFGQAEWPIQWIAAAINYHNKYGSDIAHRQLLKTVTSLVYSFKLNGKLCKSMKEYNAFVFRDDNVKDFDKLWINSNNDDRSKLRKNIIKYDSIKIMNWYLHNLKESRKDPKHTHKLLNMITSKTVIGPKCFDKLVKIIYDYIKSSATRPHNSANIKYNFLCCLIINSIHLFERLSGTNHLTDNDIYGLPSNVIKYACLQKTSVRNYIYNAILKTAGKKYADQATSIAHITYEVIYPFQSFKTYDSNHILKIINNVSVPSTGRSSYMQKTIEDIFNSRQTSMIEKLDLIHTFLTNNKISDDLYEWYSRIIQQSTSQQLEKINNNPMIRALRISICTNNVKLCRRLSQECRENNMFIIDDIMEIACTENSVEVLKMLSEYDPIMKCHNCELQICDHFVNIILK